MIFLYFLLICGIKFNEKSAYAELDDRSTCKDILPINNVTASNTRSGFATSNAVDNSSSTWWASDGKGSWIQLDLGSVQNICSVDTSWYKGNTRVYNFVLGTSTDGTNFTNILDSKTNSTGLSTEKYDINNTNVRYIRITVNGNSENNYASLSDIKVYGTLEQPNPPMNSDGNKSISTATGTKYETNPSISVGTDDSKYSEGEKVAIFGRLYNGTGFSSETLKIVVNKTHYEFLGGFHLLNESEVIPAAVVSILSDSLGRYNYNISLQEIGKYLVSASANISGNNVESFSGFEVTSIFFSSSAIMAYLAISSFLLLLVVIWIGNSKFGDLRNPQQYRRKQDEIANFELLRFLCLSAIAGFSILSFVFADSEIGVNSPIGLVKQNFAVLNKTQMQSADPDKESQWVINVGGSQVDNYTGGLQIPTYVVIFGLAGGYLRYLYGLRFFFGRWIKAEGYEDVDKKWGDLNVMDNMSFLRHSLRSLSLFFLAPLLAVAVWFILFQGGTTGKYAIAALSFSIGLITEEAIQFIITFARKIFGGISEETTKEKEDTKIKVLKTIPADGSTGVSVFTDILASFEVPIEKKTVDHGFTLSVESDKGIEDIPGTVTPGEDALTYRFVPKSRKLEPDRQYVASIEGVVDLVGRECETLAWLFSTRNRPTILKVNPLDKDKVQIDSKITVEFSEPVDEESVRKNFTVKEDDTPIRGKINVKGMTAIFTPSNRLRKERIYKVVLNKEIKDLANNEMVDGKEWVFFT